MRPLAQDLAVQQKRKWSRRSCHHVLRRRIDWASQAQNLRDTVHACKGAHDGSRARPAERTFKDRQVVVIQVSVAHNPLEMEAIYARCVAVH
jgi:hypothetical protein